MLSKSIVTIATRETFFNLNVDFNFINDYIKNITFGKSHKIILSNNKRNLTINCK